MTAESYPFRPVASLSVEQRAAFIANTYRHLLGALLAFVALEVVYFSTGLAERMAASMLGVNWLWVLGAFLVVSWLASRFAHTAATRELQYAALAVYVAAESLIFVPLLWLANAYFPGAIRSGALLAAVAFIVLPAFAFQPRRDFSFLRGVLLWGGFIALALIAGSVLIGFQLGLLFTVGMLAFAGAAILYDTSNIIHHFPEDRYVAAALELFASAALLLWYAISLFMRD